MADLNRRKFIRIAAASGLGGLAPIGAFAQSTPIKTDYDVIVIGAGVAGLAAAHDLALEGYEVLVLEARDRIGGRVATDWSLGAPFEWGAGWIHGPKGNPLSDIAQEVGLETFVTEDESLEVYTDDGSDISGQSLATSFNSLRAAITRIDNELDADMPLAEALQHFAPAVLDDPIARWYLTSSTEFDAGGPIEKLSARYVFEDKAFDGADVIPLGGYDRILAPLNKGFDVALNTPVQSVAYEAGDGAVVQAHGIGFESDFVICTVPLGVLKQDTISFSPKLPKPMRAAIQQIGMGTVTKLALKFDAAFWPVDVQYFGTLTAPKGRWPYMLNYRTFSDENILMPLSFGEYAFEADAMTDTEMVADAMDVLYEVFDDDIPDPIAHLATHWSRDPFCHGAYSFSNFGSTPAHFDTFKKPVEDTLFFAGEHTDFAYHATVHGALLSGRRAAQQVYDADDD